ncbi:MAG: hypothetical protein IKZ51_05500 [Bacteroidales bacterium]|nr:hypothetical protein [Bacteroidales bacterium]
MKKLFLLLFVVGYSFVSLYAIECSPASRTDTMPIATFGKQTGHPFAIEKVKSVLSSLPIQEVQGVNIDSIRVTHHYVRFMPSSREEMESIQLRKDLNLYQYPLDCVVSEGFVGISNPFLLNGFPQFWAIVPIAFNFKDINCPFAIESELWCPSFLCDNLKTNIEQTIPQRIEQTIYDIICSSSIEMESSQDVDHRGTTSYSPGGYVRYQDTVFGACGVQGMEVEAYNFWNHYTDYSNVNGHVSFGTHTFNGSFRYRLKFTRDDFSLKNENDSSDIEYVTDSGTCTLSVLFSGDYAKYAAVFHAAQRYYYQPIDIPRPPISSFWLARVWIHVHPNDAHPQGWHGYYHTDYGTFLWVDRPTIHIYGKDKNGDYLGSSVIYGATIHELTHAMHFGLDPDLYPSIQPRVQESLARGIQLYLTTERYPNFVVGYNINRYTAIMRDLVDEAKNVSCDHYYYETTGSTTIDTVSYYDNVNERYTYAELVEAVKTCTTPYQWFSRVYSLYNRVPGPVLYPPFKFWFDL